MTGVIALLVLLTTIAGTILYGRHKVRAKTVEEWALGGRRFGTLIFWFLNAGGAGEQRRPSQQNDEKI